MRTRLASAHRNNRVVFHEHELAEGTLLARSRSLVLSLTMKSIISRFFAAVALAAAFLVIPLNAAVTVGKPAPDFTLTDIDGQRRSLAEFKGKTVVLEWVNPECPIVTKHYESGNMPATQKAAVGDGVIWLSINSGRPKAQGDFEPAAVKAWLQQTGAKPTAYMRDQDGKVGRLFSAKTTPHMFVINKEGVLVYAGAIDSIRSGDRDDIPKATNYIVAALSSIKAGLPVANPTTQPYGCAVKY